MQVLAIGFLLVILSSALFGPNYFPLLVVATYVLAALPNVICGQCTRTDDFMYENNTGGIVDLGRFLTGFFLVMGISMWSKWLRQRERSC